MRNAGDQAIVGPIVTTTRVVEGALGKMIEIFKTPHDKLRDGGTRRFLEGAYCGAKEENMVPLSRHAQWPLQPSRRPEHRVAMWTFSDDPAK